LAAAEEAEAVGATTIVDIHGSRANRAGSFSNTIVPVSLSDVPPATTEE